MTEERTNELFAAVEDDARRKLKRRSTKGAARTVLDYLADQRKKLLTKFNTANIK